MSAEDSPARPLRARRLLLAAGVAGGGALVLLGGVWAFRMPLAHMAISRTLETRGIASEFIVERLDLAGASLRDVSLGENDFAARRVEVDFAWRPAPALDAVRLDGLVLRATLNEEGLSLGALDALLPRGDDGAAELPDLALNIADGAALVRTPYGEALLALSAAGRFGEDFAARALLNEGAFAPHGEDVRLEASARSDGAGLHMEARGGFAAFRDDDLAFEGGAVQVNLSGTDLAALSARIDADLGSARIGDTLVEGMSARAALSRGEAGHWGGDVALSLVSGALSETWRFGEARYAADLVIAETPMLSGEARIDRLALTPSGARAFARGWPALEALPLGPLSASARDAVLRAFEDARVSAPLRVVFGEALRVSAPGRVRVESAAGVRALAQPRGDAPLVTLSLGDEVRVSGAGALEIAGPGAPPARIELERLQSDSAGAVSAFGAASIADWSAGGARLDAPAIAWDFKQHGGRSTLRLTSDARISGPLGAAFVEDLAAPYDILLRWGDGVSVSLADGRCLNATFETLSAPGLVFQNGAAPLCMQGDVFFAQNRVGETRGGVTLAAPRFAGHVEGAPAQRADFAAARIDARFSGAASQFVMDAAIDQPRLDVLRARDAVLRLRGSRIDAKLLAADGTWSARGVLEGGEADDPTLPARVRGARADWSATPEGDEAIIRFENGFAALQDAPPPNAPADRRRAFNPMEARDIEGVLRGGVLTADGVVLLAEGARRLSAFDLSHDLNANAGEARIRLDGLRFDETLQPFEITELARGVVENVRGPVGGAVIATWRGEEVRARGQFILDGLSLATSTLPVIEGVSGAVAFDDLFLLTTPPAQSLTIARLNPGVEVRDGALRFQLLGEGAVSLEHAAWPFAGGELSIEPTRLTLGAEETRLNLVLRKVDVAALLAQLNVPDLVATGEVGGRFPLRLTTTGAFVENGELAASEAGGTIVYAGAAGKDAQGPAKLAFDALTQFRYDDLSLEINGDLAGELVTAINFRGRNASAVELGAGPGPIRTRVAGVPFIFNVRVTAPFRRLGEIAAGAFDPRAAIRQAGQNQAGQDQAGQNGETQTPEPPPAIDQAPASPR